MISIFDFKFRSSSNAGLVVAFATKEISPDNAFTTGSYLSRFFPIPYAAPFRSRCHVDEGFESSVFTSSLQRAGYRTGMFGKYLNGMEVSHCTRAEDPKGTVTPPPPGWDRYFAMYAQIACLRDALLLGCSHLKIVCGCTALLGLRRGAAALCSQVPLTLHFVSSGAPIPATRTAPSATRGTGRCTMTPPTSEVQTTRHL